MGLSGAISRPGVYEHELGIKLTDLIETSGQGALPGEGNAIKGYFHGGISMGVLTEEEAQAGVEMDFDIGKKWNNLGLGTACVTVIPERTSMVAMARNCARFYAHESCGQCTQCREGSRWLNKMLDRMVAGDGTTKDLDLLLELASSMGSMPGNNICGLSDGANWAIRTIVNKFWDEFEAIVSKPSRVSLAVVLTEQRCDMTTEGKVEVRRPGGTEAQRHRKVFRGSALLAAAPPLLPSVPRGAKRSVPLCLF